MNETEPVADYSGNRLPSEVRAASPEWLKNYDRRLLVLFTHVPKAGGTGLKQAMTRAYGRHFTDHHPTMNNVVDAVAADRVDPRDILALSSHMPYGFHRRIEGLSARRVLPFTVVRDPLKRMVSYYNFVTTFRPHRLHSATRDMDINAFFRHLMTEGVGEISNGQCRLVSGNADRSAEAAIRVLESEYFAFGPLDLHSELLDSLRSTLGWPIQPTTDDAANSSPKRAGVSDMDDEIRAELEARNTEDLALYATLTERGVVVNDSLL